jgi:hypothetical protein
MPALPSPPRGSTGATPAPGRRSRRRPGCQNLPRHGGGPSRQGGPRGLRRRHGRLGQLAPHRRLPNRPGRVGRHPAHRALIPSRPPDRRGRPGRHRRRPPDRHRPPDHRAKPDRCRQRRLDRRDRLGRRPGSRHLLHLNRRRLHHRGPPGLRRTRHHRGRPGHHHGLRNLRGRLDSSHARPSHHPRPGRLRDRGGRRCWGRCGRRGLRLRGCGWARDGRRGATLARRSRHGKLRDRSGRRARGSLPSRHGRRSGGPLWDGGASPLSHRTGRRFRSRPSPPAGRGRTARRPAGRGRTARRLAPPDHTARRARASRRCPGRRSGRRYGVKRSRGARSPMRALAAPARRGVAGRTA